MEDLRVALDVAAILGGTTGLITYLMTLRQHRGLLDAQAHKTTDEGSAALVGEVGRAAAAVLAETAKSLPLLQTEVARLGAALESERRRGDRLERELEAERAKREQLEVDVAADRRERDSLLTWARDHSRWDALAMSTIEQLGGHIETPAPPPDRRPVLVRPGPPPAAHP